MKLTCRMRPVTAAAPWFLFHRTRSSWRRRSRRRLSAVKVKGACIDGAAPPRHTRLEERLARGRGGPAVTWLPIRAAHQG